MRKWMDKGAAKAKGGTPAQRGVHMEHKQHYLSGFNFNSTVISN